MTEQEFDDYDRPALRKEIAFLFSNALPSECYGNINDVRKIADMQEGDLYYNDVLKLFCAGILAGHDEQGSFAPDLTIKRCEAAAILSRIAEPSSRIKVE